MCLTVAEKRKSRNGKHQKGGKWCRRSTRLAIYMRDGFKCLLCGADLHDVEPREITLDHVIPQSKGGTNHPSNLATACNRCNCSKQDKDLSDFVADQNHRRRIYRRIRKDLTPFRSLAITFIKDALKAKGEAK
jgi:5-methylcytosine-specific restriction endonuclease McrA